MRHIPWDLKAFLLVRKLLFLEKVLFFYVCYTDFLRVTTHRFLSANCECKKENVWLFFPRDLVRKGSAFHWIDAEQEDTAFFPILLTFTLQNSAQKYWKDTVFEKNIQVVLTLEAKKNSFFKTSCHLFLKYCHVISA